MLAPSSLACFCHIIVIIWYMKEICAIPICVFLPDYVPHSSAGTYLLNYRASHLNIHWCENLRSLYILSSSGNFFHKPFSNPVLHKQHFVCDFCLLWVLGLFSVQNKLWVTVIVDVSSIHAQMVIMHINLAIIETGLLFPTIHIEQNFLLHRPNHMLSLIVWESGGFCIWRWYWEDDVNRKFHT